MIVIVSFCFKVMHAYWKYFKIALSEEVSLCNLGSLSRNIGLFFNFVTHVL